MTITIVQFNDALGLQKRCLRIISRRAASVFLFAAVTALLVDAH
eukprot:COSAG01_NODE_65553_length_273_cov_0.574713_1_plen_43_part_10